MLKFSVGNGKLAKDTAIFNLPAGHTCPGAQDCLARADKMTGKIIGGKQSTHRCFSASMEALRPNVRESRWHNLETVKKLLKTQWQMAESIAGILTSRKYHSVKYLRIHESGDFFSSQYLAEWIRAAELCPNIVFYAYTKSAHLFVDLEIPENFVVTYSIGGKHDDKIPECARTARVVFSEEEAARLGLPIDHDDTIARDPNSGPFALLIHGVQPAGTLAAQSVAELRRRGEFGYGPSADARRKALPVI